MTIIIQLQGKVATTDYHRALPLISLLSSRVNEIIHISCLVVSLPCAYMLCPINAQHIIFALALVYIYLAIMKSINYLFFRVLCLLLKQCCMQRCWVTFAKMFFVIYHKIVYRYLGQAYYDHWYK